MSNSKAVILARVSSTEQRDSGYSLPAQERLMRDYCDKNDFGIAKVFVIAEAASEKKQRTVFKEMMKYLEDKKINILVVEKVDRLTRNYRDAVVVDDWLNENEKRVVHFVKNGFSLHQKSHSQEKFSWGIHIVMAKNFIDNLREEVMKGQKEKLLQGWLPAKAPRGYLNIGEEKRRIQTIDPDTAPLIRKMFELYDTGDYSTVTLGKKMAELGLRSRNDKILGRSSVHKILTNSYYAGIITWCGVEYQGIHEPIVDKALFERVQVCMKRLNPPKYGKHPFLYKGMIICAECGGTITWETQKGIRYGHCNRYRGCPKKPYAVEGDVENEMLTYFNQLIAPSQEIIDWTKEQLLNTNQKDTELQKSSLAQLHGRQKKIQTMLGTLYDDRLEGRIDVDKYDAKVKDLEREQAAIVHSLEKAVSVDAVDIKRNVNILELTQKAARIYDEKDNEGKRALLRDLFSNITLDGKQLGCEYKKEAGMIFEAVKKTKHLIATFEPRNSSLLQIKTAQGAALRSIWQE